MSSPSKSYCVSVVEYDCYTLWVAAPNESEALKLAQANWDEHGADAWRHSSNGTDGFEVIDERVAR